MSNDSYFILPARVRVRDHAGEHLSWADQESARKLIADHVVTVIARKRRVVFLRLGPDTALSLDGAFTPHKGRKYSHDRETPDNPKGCWTLVMIPNSQESEFTRVRDECMKAA